MTKSFLNSTYGLDSVAKTIEHYDQWAASYEREISENGYALPKRIAEAAANAVTDKGAAVLDFGCGTGLSGLALRAAGFEVIHGMDVSRDMLAQAELKTAYAKLTRADAEAPPPFEAGDYGLVVACGVIGSGAAPLFVLDQLAERVTSGGMLAFSFNDHTLSDPSFEARVVSYGKEGFNLLFQEHGEHLPGIDLKSTVYVLQRI